MVAIIRTYKIERNSKEPYVGNFFIRDSSGGNNLSQVTYKAIDKKNALQLFDKCAANKAKFDIIACDIDNDMNNTEVAIIFKKALPFKKLAFNATNLLLDLGYVSNGDRVIPNLPQSCKKWFSFDSGKVVVTKTKFESKQAAQLNTFETVQCETASSCMGYAPKK